jgi:hypothetical protein
VGQVSVRHRRSKRPTPLTVEDIERLQLQLLVEIDNGLGPIPPNVNVEQLRKQVTKTRRRNMAKPEEGAPGQQKIFTVVHPTEPDSPKQVTQAEWSEQKLGQAGWTKVDPDEPHVEHHS